MKNACEHLAAEQGRLMLPGALIKPGQRRRIWKLIVTRRRLDANVKRKKNLTQKQYAYSGALVAST